MIMFIYQLRLDLADLLHDEAAKTRTMHTTWRERMMRNLDAATARSGVNRDKAVAQLERSLGWQQGNLGLAWANLFDHLATRIRPGDTPI